MATNENRRLFRSQDSIIAGVCAGLAEFFGLDTSLVRIATLLLIFFGGLSLWVYIILWLIVPKAPKRHSTMAEDNVKAQMRKGILEYCILAILSREDSYAPKIIAELKQAEMIVVEGTLYPILTRQKNAGLLTYRWEESPQGPPRKYYTLTDKGREYLATLDEAWDELVGQIQLIRHGKNN